MLYASFASIYSMKSEARSNDELLICLSVSSWIQKRVSHKTDMSLLNTILFKVGRPVRSSLRRLPRIYYSLRVRIQVASCGSELRVNALSRVTRHTHLGRNVNFNGMTVRGSGLVRIGDNFHSGEGCLMISQIHNYDHGTAIPYDDTYIPKDIIIGDNVWLGDRVIILGESVIGEGAIIQAGSCVVGDIPRCAIVGGHPAKVFKYRDVDHYEGLKAASRFH